MTEPLLKNGINNRFLFATIVIVAIICYFFNLGKPPVYILDEAKNAQCAREMFERRDYIVPTFNGELRTDKPVLHYYFMIAAYKMFGVNEFSARFFSAVFGVLTVISLFWFTRRFLGSRVALFTALVWLASININLEFHLAVPDPYLIFFISTSLFAVYTFLETGKRGWLWTFYVCLGLGTLTKGPVAIALPGLIVLLYLLCQWRISFKTLFGEMQPFVGILIILLIAGPWYLAVHNATDGAWTRGFFLEHNFDRFSAIKEGHGGFWGLTAVFILLGLLPFAVFIIQTSYRTFEQIKHPFIQFSSIVAVVFLVFFTISKTKLPNYTMPSYPFYAVLLGNYLVVLTDTPRRSLTRSIIAYVVLSVMIPIAIFLIIKKEEPIAHLSLQALWFCILTVGSAIAVGYFIYSRWSHLVFSIAGTFILMNIVFMGWVYPAVYNENPIKRSIHLIDQQKPIAAYRLYNPAYNFYLKQRVTRLEDTSSLRKFINEHPDLTLISRDEHTTLLSKLGLKRIFAGKDIFESPVTVLFKKQ